MSKSKIEFPGEFRFVTNIPVRITDINYGGHMGNDSFLSILHEARMQFLAQWGYTEMNMAGIGMIMSDVNIEFKNELFYGDVVVASVMAANLNRASFDLFYKLEREKDGVRQLICVARTGMVCYDYERKKVAALPEEARQSFTN